MAKPQLCAIGVDDQQDDQVQDDLAPAAVSQVEESEDDVQHCKYRDEHVRRCAADHRHLGEPEVDQAEQDHQATVEPEVEAGNLHLFTSDVVNEGGILAKCREDQQRANHDVEDCGQDDQDRHDGDPNRALDKGVLRH